MTTVFEATNIVSALGLTTDEVFDNIRQGRTGLSLQSDHFDLPEPFMASLIDRARGFRPTASAYLARRRLYPIRAGSHRFCG